jgi:hypothetical protein
VAKGIAGARRHRSAIWLALLCSCASQQREPAGDTSAGSEAPVAQVARAAVPLQPAAPAPPPPATVRIVNAAPGRFLLEADARVEVATGATMQHRSADGQWVSAAFELQDSCTAPASGAPRCRALVPGMPFAPLSWNGRSCGPCCPDQNAPPIEAGLYRLVLQTCAGQRWEGPPFEAPATTDALERWRATSNVERVTVYRLNRDFRFDRDGDTGYIVGGPIEPGSEVEISTGVVPALLDWLRDDSAFSNEVMRRCSRGQSFGFRLQRNVPGLGLERSDIAVDLRCRSIAVENQEGALWRRSYSYFDNSRPALLNILRSALPGAALTGVGEH